MTEDEGKLIESSLKDMISRASDWVKFGEAKNAALLTFCSAWLLAMGNLVYGANPAPEETRVALAWAAPFIFAGASLSILALLPRGPKWKHPRSQRQNPLFYGAYAILGAKGGLDQIRSDYELSSGQKLPEIYLMDLADQVSGLAVVAERKYRLFNFGASSVLTAIMTFFVVSYAPHAFEVAQSIICRP